MTLPCDVTLDELLAYRLGELSEAQEAELEEHLFECPRCADRAAFIAAAGREVKQLFWAGRLSSGATSRLLQQARAMGMTLRSYAIAPGGSVNCTARPDDDLVVVRLEVEAGAEERIDLEVETRVVGQELGQAQRSLRQEVARDAQTGELLFVFAGDAVRAMPKSTWVMRAHVHGASGSRELGPYTMNHTPWDQLPD